MAFIAELLSSAGIQTSIHEKAPGRANLVARIPGGNAPALMLTGHIDVVTTADQSWTHPPFAAETIDGVIWGRGTLDMKGGIAMMLAAAVRVAASGFRPAGDLVLAFVADEEAGGRLGASYLVDEHPELFSGVHYAIGEFGGFPLRIGKTRFTMIQVAEKQICLIEATIRGPAGHGSRPMRGGAMATLARVLDRLDRIRLPIHVTPVAECMVESIACRLPILERVVLRRLLDPRFTDRILGLLGESGRLFEPLFRHTANVTIVRGGEKTNVIPGRIRLVLDGRILPGFGPDDLLRELRGVVGDDVNLEVRLYDSVAGTSDLGLFDLLGDCLAAHEPGAVSVPYLLPGSTDARHFARLGIQSYGFTPMNLPLDTRFFDTIHAADERIPASAVRFGTDVLYDVIRRYRDTV